MSREITSGSWKSAELMEDYRAERFNEMYVERATWTAEAPEVKIGDVTVVAPGYIWFRFWLLDIDQVVEKYFSADRQPIGLYTPICAPLQTHERHLSATDLVLAIWLDLDGRMTVLNEPEFDAAVASGELSAAESEQAEVRIREFTLGMSQKLFPPAMVRQFILKTELSDPVDER